MQNTLLVGLSRQVVLERQMDVVANNLANVNTTGFKAERSVFWEFLNTNAHEDNFQSRDRRVSFVQDRAAYHDFATGQMEPTKNPLDIAIDGSAFLVVQTPSGERYTRDGSLQIDAQGTLVTANGEPVLGNAGPIVFQPTDNQISIAGDGTISVRQGNATTDSVRGQFRLVSFASQQSLQKEGSNLFSSTSDPGAPDTTARVRQGFLEHSNVNSVLEMTKMVEVTRSYTQIATMLQDQSDLHKSAIDKLAESPT